MILDRLPMGCLAHGGGRCDPDTGEHVGNCDSSENAIAVFFSPDCVL